MTLYIQDENYHFNGSLSGVIVDNQRTAIFSKNGIEDFNLDIDFNSLDWYDLDSFELVNNTCLLYTFVADDANQSQDLRNR
ncbi:hypothetical protein O8C99_10865 [Aliarcobacter butzleri]|uniref:hypothetical protein n=1 Tax=Aliarcobacter butzleri TaxID=28197 RepID=UPI00263D9459|nr:hypothetical protein [Aliarcobacter butzleri]MDN5103664.1 hypothetical protein [Aliarcobacter butzleri]